METQTVEMTPEELQQFEAFKQQKEAENKKQKEKEDRDAYKVLIDEILEKGTIRLNLVSKALHSVKNNIITELQKAIELKSQLFGTEKLDQQSHTFTNSAGNVRITYGQYMNDGYRDTVNEGVALVKKAIEELATDDNSRALVNTVLRLLAKDQKGNLKASRVLQLRKTADDSGNETLQKGVRIIEESYQPTPSKSFIRLETKKDKDSEWVNVPLGMTEA